MVIQQIAVELDEDQSLALGFNEPESDGGAINLRVNGDPAQGVATDDLCDTVTDLLDRAERLSRSLGERVARLAGM